MASTLRFHVVKAGSKANKNNISPAKYNIKWRYQGALFGSGYTIIKKQSVPVPISIIEFPFDHVYKIYDELMRVV